MKRAVYAVAALVAVTEPAMAGAADYWEEPGRGMRASRNKLVPSSLSGGSWSIVIATRSLVPLSGVRRVRSLAFRRPF